MGFDDEYVKFIQSHQKRRKGERRDRLRYEHGHAEKRFLQNVWWPAFEHFNGLHPEYEVYDFKDGHRYIDFAFIQSRFRIAIEIDGFGPHLQNVTKWQFADHCQRQNHLVIDGWHVLRFAYGDVDERPRLCQQTIHQLMGRLLGEASAELRVLSLIEREIVRLAIRSARPVTPTQVSQLLHMSRDTAQRHLHELVDRSWLQPASGTLRVRSYQVHPSRGNIRL